LRRGGYIKEAKKVPELEEVYMAKGADR